MKKLFNIFLILGCVGISPAQEKPKELTGIDSPFEATVGKLDNGLSYIIKPLKGDKGKINVGLFVNAGANQENSEQYQFSHLLEHLAANYTENFANIRLNAELFSHLKITPQDYTAFVGGKSTRYNIHYQQAIPKSLDTLLSIFHDIASGKVLFDEKIVNTERKALYQEYLFSNTSKSYPEYVVQNTLSGCRDFIPSPENFESVLMNSSIESLKEFYLDWYRPDLMTVYIIGNFENSEEIEKKIKEKFRGLKMPASKRKKIECLDDYKKRPKQFVVQKRDVTPPPGLPSQITFQFYFRNEKVTLKQFSKDHDELKRNITRKMVDNRLNSIELDYNIDYTTNFSKSLDMSAYILEIKTLGENQKVINKVFGLLSGILKYGFTHEELAKVVEKEIKNLQNRNYSTSTLWSDIIQNAIVYGEPLPDSKNDDEIDFLSNLEIEQVNIFFKKEMDWKPDDIAIIVPKDTDENHFTNKQIRNWVSIGLKQPIEYQPKKIPKQFLSDKEIMDLPQAKILNKNFGDLNEDIIELSNGLKIILKVTNPSTGRYKDKIMVHGFSPKGAGCFENEDYDALFAPLITQNSGVGNFNKFIVKKVLDETSIPFGIKSYVEKWETGVKAEIAPEDMEILMQLIYLTFTEPRYDPEAFEDWRIQEQQYYLRNNSPNNNFVDFLNRETGILKIQQGKNRYKKSLNVDYNEAYRKYKSLFANGDDFTFIITGNFKKNNILPVLRRYLGNLPNKSTPKCNTLNSKIPELKKRLKDAKYSFPKNVDNDFLAIKYITPLRGKPDFKEEIQLEFIKQAINLKLMDLRNKLGLGVYLSIASSSIDYNNKTREITIYLRSNREDFERVMAACNNLVEELKTEPVPCNLFKNIKQSSYLPKWQGTSDMKNKTAMQTLYDLYRFEVPIAEENKASQYMESFDSEDLLDIANIYLNEDYRGIYIGSPLDEL